jgi:hypothetical protein
MIDFTPQAQMAAIQSTPGLRLYTDKKVSVVMFAMRQEPPLDNVKVRQAAAPCVQHS